MTLLIRFLLFPMQGLLTEELEGEVTEGYGPKQLWRAMDVTLEEVLELFDIRAHQTDEIWKHNNSIDFILNKDDIVIWRDVFEAFNITYAILDPNVTEIVGDEYIKKYNDRTGPVIEEVVTEVYGQKQFWRASPVTDREVLDIFYARARHNNEIWKLNDTIDFILYKNETHLWRELLEDFNITYRVLDDNVQGEIDNDYLLQFRDSRRGGGVPYILLP